MVHLAKMRGACPRTARPYKMREDVKRKELPAEKAEVKTHALMMCGRALIPARLMAITY